MTFLPIYAILPDSTNAMNGSSKPRNFYRELPDGEMARAEIHCEYIPELCTERHTGWLNIPGSINKLQRIGTRYSAKV